MRYVNLKYCYDGGEYVIVMIFQAHKGVSTEFPENTMPAYIAAIGQGYQIIVSRWNVVKTIVCYMTTMIE